MTLNCAPKYCTTYLEGFTLPYVTDIIYFNIKHMKSLKHLIKARDINQFNTQGKIHFKDKYIYIFLNLGDDTVISTMYRYFQLLHMQ